MIQEGRTVLQQYANHTPGPEWYVVSSRVLSSLAKQV